MITSKDFSVGMSPHNLQNRLLITQPNILRVFWDDTWTGTRDVILHFSGDRGNNPQNVESIKPSSAVAKGYIWIDVMADTQSTLVPVWNFYPPLSGISGGHLDVSHCINAVFEILAADHALSPILTQQSRLVLSGHSYGATVLLRYAARHKEVSGQVHTEYDHRIAGRIVNSPFGGNHGGDGHRNISREMQDLYRMLSLAASVVVCIPAGDVTHLSREVLIRVFNTDVRNNQGVQIKIVGDQEYGHGFPGSTTYGPVWVDMCIGMFDEPIKGEYAFRVLSSIPTVHRITESGDYRVTE